MSVAADIVARVVDRLRSIDGTAKTFTLHGQIVSHTYTFDLSDPDRVRRGMSGPPVPPPYANVFQTLTPGEDGTSICKTRWRLSIDVDAIASVGDMLSDTEHTAALNMANDIVVAIMADRDAQTAGSLRALGAESIQPTVSQLTSGNEGIEVAGCRVTFEMTYQTSGIGL